jgi:signal transduction histidine kinase
MMWDVSKLSPGKRMQNPLRIREAIIRVGYFVACFAMTPAAHAQLQSIASVLQADKQFTAEVTVRGTVTHTGKEVFIQDSTGGLQLLGVKPLSRLALGDEIEVVGTPRFDAPPSLRLRSVRRIWSGSTPLPMAIDADQAAEGSASNLLVQITAKLIKERVTRTGETELILQSESQNFSATISSNETPESIGLPPWPLGGQLSLTGVLVLHPEEPTFADVPFQLLLQSSQDVDVIRPPPWWNVEHTSWFVLGTCILLLLAFVQQQHVRSLRSQAVLEERGRIARDIHDTLAQGFAGITLQMESAELLLERNREGARDALRLALQMVRRCRSEAHTSIRVLHSLSRDEPLHRLFERSTSDFLSEHFKVLHVVDGQPFSVPYEMTNQFFQVGMEAFANAVQHAGASRIEMTTRYDSQQLSVCIADDGCGFDPEHAPGIEQGHFGLAGLRDRMAAVNGHLRISTSVGEGTRLTATAPRKGSR